MDRLVVKKDSPRSMKPPPGASIAGLISGGVDSAVAVHRLVEQGFGPGLHLFYIRIGLDTDERAIALPTKISKCVSS